MKNNIIIGMCENGMKCMYEAPFIENAEEFKSLIYDWNENPKQREELQGQPKLLGLRGPMFNGFGYLESTGEKVARIRYEKPCKY